MVKTFCIVENGVVVNRVISEKPLAENWVETNIGQMFDLYDGVNFTKPLPPDPEPEQKTRTDRAIEALIAKGLLTPEDVNGKKI